MELNELMDLWKEDANQLDDKIQVNQDLLKESSFNKVKWLMAEHIFENVVEVIANTIFAWILLVFVREYFFEFKFLLSGLFLLVLMISGVVMSVYRLMLIFSINYKSSILEAQQNINKIYLMNKYEIRALIFLIPLFSVTFLAVSLRLIGLDIYSYDWIWSYFIGCFVVGLIIVFCMIKFPDKKMKKAISFLNEIEEYRK